MNNANKKYPNLGCGTKGCVFDIGDGKVIKVFYNDPAYLDYVRVAQKNQNNPYFPKIYSINQEKDGAYIVTQEKLYPITQKQNLERSQIAWLVIMYDMKKMKKRTFSDYEKRAKNISLDMFRDFLPGGIDPEKIKNQKRDLWNIALAISNLVDMGANTDMKKRNSMARSNGQLVIVDPIA